MTQNQPPNFIFFGTPYVARDTLALLVEDGFRPATVVTNPDRPQGRGMKFTPSETNIWASSHNIPVLTPRTLDQDALKEIRACGADFAIVVAYGKLFPQALIDLFPKGVVNIHYSLLPKYRGAAPVETAILNCETTTGVSIQKMTLALDAGDILSAQSISIRTDETTRELRPRLVTLGAKLLAKLLPDVATGSLHGIPQEPSLATYAPKIKKEDGKLSLSTNANENWNKYRAYIEGSGTYFFATKNGKKIRVKITRASYTQNIFVIECVIPEGKREQPYDVFMRGGWAMQG